MKEIDVIIHAKGYMDLLSKGINPITKEKCSQNSELNNERLLKCFSFVSEILERVIVSEKEKEINLSNENKEISHTEKEKVNASPQNQEYEELLYSPNSLVSEEIEGIDVVNTLIKKGVLKQGLSSNKE